MTLPMFLAHTGLSETTSSQDASTGKGLAFISYLANVYESEENPRPQGQKGKTDTHTLPKERA